MVPASPNLPGRRLLGNLRIRSEQLRADLVANGAESLRGRQVPGRWVAAAALVAVAVPLLAARIGSRTLTLSVAERQLAAAHGTWHRMFDYAGITSRYPVLFWVLALVILGLIGLPYVWIAGASLPDRGFTLARPIALLLVSWLVWWLASLRVVAFTRGAIALSAGVFALGSAVIVARRHHELADWLRTHWRLLLVAETLFWALLAAGILIRWANPDLWHPSRGGEKPMDFAYLNAVLKTTHFPPFDPWFAGGQMNYYYYGFVLIAVLIKATSIVPSIAYNLAVPTLLAFLGTAAFGATLALFSSPERPRAWRLGRSVPIALLGALLVAVLGNLGELRVIFSSLSQRIPIEWWYWNPTRVIHHPLTEPGPINELPFFTYLFGDLHAHAIALPYAAVTLALAFGLVRGARSPNGRAGAVMTFLLLALVVGALWPINTWDFPTYTLVVLVALVLQQAQRGFSPRAVAGLVARGAAFIALAYLVFLPFHLRYYSVFNGIERWHGSHTRVNDYLTIHGLFLFAIASGLLLDLWTARDANSVARFWRFAIRSWDRIRRFRELHRALVKPSLAHDAGIRAVPAAFVLAAALGVLGEGVLALAIPVATLALLSLFRGRRGGIDPTRRALWQMAVALMLIGLVLTVAVEYYVVKNIDIGRTNTVFKTYLQVWVMWGIAAAIAIGTVFERLPKVRRPIRLAWPVALMSLVAIAALYPILATKARVGDRFDTSVGGTLDGAAFMRKAVLFDQSKQIPLKYDWAAIRWIQETISGSPVIAEANTAPVLYGWEGRYSVYTGNPTIVGWDYHQRQQRPPQAALVDQRVRDLQTAYRTTDPELAYRTFRRYGASYFVVGLLERTYFPQGQDKWASGVGKLWTLVYRNPGVQIYRLLPPS
jgi:YYY domain-containing protein